MIFSETNTEVAPALAKAWAALENPKHNASVTVKTKSGSSYKFDYTDLGGIFDEAKRVFKENGLTIIQNAYTVVLEGKKLVSVETMLLHSSGEYVKSLPLQFDANASMQDMGGQITYMKRYSLSAMLGLATEKDDDANGASGNEYQFNNQKGVSKAAVLAKWKTLAGSEEGFDDFYNKQKEQGYNENQMDAFLTKKLQAKQKGA
ncbi:ERF family protein [Bacillus solitudinis]|uniref:ERF family protein n=1 Tax=Bacillus solitudinis TaxID=2014074 RepID=UPI000C24B2E9|nr:ERF family protein [Bacillus solitudinis]